MISTVLVGVDDSKNALAALRWADDLISDLRARGMTARGVMLSTWASPALELRGLFQDEPLEAAASELVDRLARELKQPDAFERRTSRGLPAPALLAAGAELDADLIVLGRRGRGLVARVLLGSVSRHVAGRAERPVAVIPEADPGPGSTTVVAYDDSPGARAGLRWAIENTDGPIRVVMAWTLPSAVIFDRNDPTARAVEQAAELALTTGLKQACGGSIPARVEPVLTHGDPRLVLLDRQLDPERIVIGQRSHAGIHGALLGSIADYVAGHSPCPIIVVPPMETPDGERSETSDDDRTSD